MDIKFKLIFVIVCLNRNILHFEKTHLVITNQAFLTILYLIKCPKLTINKDV